MDERTHKLPITGEQINELRNIILELKSLESDDSEYAIILLNKALEILETQQ